MIDVSKLNPAQAATVGFYGDQFEAAKAVMLEALIQAGKDADQIAAEMDEWCKLWWKAKGVDWPDTFSFVNNTPGGI